MWLWILLSGCDSSDPSCYFDVDRDGFGAGEPLNFCDDRAVRVDGDCDDSRPDVSPDAAEVCDGVDNDCDGIVDADTPDPSVWWYRDADGDGFGDPRVAQRSCAPASGYVADNTDCYDGDAGTFPGADERCDGSDNDCDGIIDERPIDPGSVYVDRDGDGYGDPTLPVVACRPSDGQASDGTDCDDSDATVHPTADEVCNDRDDDCDGISDNLIDLGFAIYFWDADDDGYGDAAAPSPGCSPGRGFVDRSDDCDDSNALSYPGADEWCDEQDNNCDGAVDEGIPVDAPTFYIDRDADGYGDPLTAAQACEAPSGYVADGEDCDDLYAGVYPGADEICDSRDNDCDGPFDEDPIDGDTFYKDEDGDGFGDPDRPRVACLRPHLHVADGTDCDDTDALAYPGTERCDCSDGKDSDSDGLVDCEDGDCADVSPCAELNCSDGEDEDEDDLIDCLDEDCWGTDDCDSNQIRAHITAGAIRGEVTRYAYERDTETYYSVSGALFRRSSWFTSGSTQAMVQAEDVAGSVRFLTESGATIDACTWQADRMTFSSTLTRSDRLATSSGGPRDFDYNRAFAGVALSSGCGIDVALADYLPQNVGVGVGTALGRVFESGTIDGLDVEVTRCSPSVQWLSLTSSVASSTTSSSTGSSTIARTSSTGARVWSSSTRTRTFSGALGEGDAYTYGACVE
ncbi:MAG: putative metal-binding motif-containing protein [Myxococcota bacterium]